MLMRTGNVNHGMELCNCCCKSVLVKLEITMRNVEFNVELDDDGCTPSVQEKCLEKADGI